MAAAGSYWVDRRRDELTMLGARGVGPAAVGAKAALELVGRRPSAASPGSPPPSSSSAVLGPSSVVEDAAIRDAGRNAVLAVLVARGGARRRPALLARRLGDERRRFRRGALDGALGGGAATAAASGTGGRASEVCRWPEGIEVAQIDVLALAFPLLFIVGSWPPAARLLGFGCGCLRRRGRRLPTPAYLAARRLPALRRWCSS